MYGARFINKRSPFLEPVEHYPDDHPFLAHFPKFSPVQSPLPSDSLPFTECSSKMNEAQQKLNRGNGIWSSWSWATQPIDNNSSSGIIAGIYGECTKAGSNNYIQHHNINFDNALYLDKDRAIHAMNNYQVGQEIRMFGQYSNSDQIIPSDIRYHYFINGPVGTPTEVEPNAPEFDNINSDANALTENFDMGRSIDKSFAIHCIKNNGVCEAINTYGQFFMGVCDRG